MILNFSLFIVIVGFLDDLKNLSATNKLILQSIPIFFLVFNYNFFITDLGEYPYLGTINLGTFAPIFTLLCIFLFINACNYLDGIDGSLSIIYLNSVMILFLITENKNIDINYFYITITFPVVIFLFFNLIPFFPKNFLGDSGSLLLGYLLSCLMIISHNNFQIHPILVAWSVNLIVFDFLFVNIKRIKLNKNILIPGKDHIQHACLSYTKSITLSNLILISINSFFAVIGILTLNYFNSLISLITYLITFVFYALIRNKFI
jgi:UDP-GlcNAc:undecaprenyl-phosphate GlcNAc-1-phosphate transferase